MGFREPEDRARSDRKRQEETGRKKRKYQREKDMLFKISEYHTLGWIACAYLFMLTAAEACVWLTDYRGSVFVRDMLIMECGALLAAENQSTSTAALSTSQP